MATPMRIGLGVLLLLLGGCVQAVAAQPATAPASTQPQPPAANWPMFRGPGQNGLAVGAEPPATIDLAKLTRFKVPAQANGNSSPIVWNNRVYLTGEEDRIVAFDRASGQLAWDTMLRVPPPLADEEQEEPDEMAKLTGTAAPTPCTDGERVYAFFGDGIIGCVDLAGRQVWAFRLTDQPRKNVYGLAASPIVRGGVVYQVVDLGAEPDDGLSFVVALRADSGKELWRTERPVRSGWATPILIRAPSGREELITCGDPWVIAYAPATGEELWRVNGLSGDVAASPIYRGGVLYCPAGEGGPLLAIRPGGQGDLTKSAVLFKSDEPAPDVAGPLCDGQRYFHLSAAGDLLCLDAAKGTTLWQQDLKGKFWASPVLAGGRLYVLEKDGSLLVVSAADGKVLSEAELGEKTYASPAVVDGRLYVRGAKHLFCLGQPRP